MPGMSVLYHFDSPFLSDDVRDRLLSISAGYAHTVVEKNPTSGPMTWLRKKLDRFIRDCAPDFDDPATFGCLLFLVRQAWSSPTAYVACDNSSPPRWAVHDLDVSPHWCNSEAEALVVALELSDAAGDDESEEDDEADEDGEDA